MILKAGATIKYGIPYMGSKTKLVDKICKFFPDADNFYDLFGGGFSVSHYMIKHRKRSFKNFHYNDLRPGLADLIRDAISGKYNYDVFKPDWISRERFFAEKESNPYIKIIWSFGNNGKDYLFGKEIEEEKRSMHNAVVFNEFEGFVKDVVGLKEWPNDLTIQGKRLYLRRLFVSMGNKKYGGEAANILQQLERLEQLQQLEQLQRLERLQQLEKLQQLELTTLDYREVEIEPNSVIYCDIPYKGTAAYDDSENSFSHKDFFDWADAQENPVFISEYQIDDSRFRMLKEFSHRTTLAAQKQNAKTVERLYCNKAALKYFTK